MQPTAGGSAQTRTAVEARARGASARGTAAAAHLRHHGRAWPRRPARPPSSSRPIRRRAGAASSVVRADAGPDRRQPRNPETWRPLLPLFDPAVQRHHRRQHASASSAATRSATSSRRRPRGSIDWAARPSTTRPSSLRLFYADPAALKRRSEAVEVTAPAARKIRAASCSPAASGIGPTSAVASSPRSSPRSRAPTPTRAGSTTTHTSIMAEEVYRGGMPERSGYTKVDWEVMADGTVGDPEGDMRCATHVDGLERVAWRHCRFHGAV